MCSTEICRRFDNAGRSGWRIGRLGDHLRLKMRTFSGRTVDHRRRPGADNSASAVAASTAPAPDQETRLAGL